MKPLLIVLLLGGAISWVYTEEKEHRALQISLDQTRAQLRETQNQLQAVKLQLQATTAKRGSSAEWMWKSDPLSAPATAGQHK